MRGAGTTLPRYGEESCPRHLYAKAVSIVQRESNRSNGIMVVRKSEIDYDNKD